MQHTELDLSEKCILKNEPLRTHEGEKFIWQIDNEINLDKKRTEWKFIHSVQLSRDDWIRTSDLFVPNEARYQAAPHPDGL